MSSTLLPRTGNPLYEAWCLLTHGINPNDWYTSAYQPTQSDVFEAASTVGAPHDSLTSLLGAFGTDPFLIGHTIRDVAVHKFSWAIPSPEAIALIARYSPLVDWGAGKGYWASLLAEAGADIICMDVAPPIDDSVNHWADAGLYYPVTKGDDVVGFADRTLLVIWPPYHPNHHHRWGEHQAPSDPENWEYTGWVNSDGATHASWRQPNADPDLSADVLASYTAAGGRRVIYIGEGSGGCTGSDAFHAQLGDCWHDTDNPCTHQPVWQQVGECAIPQWPGIHDHLYVYDRTITILDEE